MEVALRRTSPPAHADFHAAAAVSDSFTVVLRCLLLLFAILFTTFTQIASAAGKTDWAPLRAVPAKGVVPFSLAT